MQSMKTKRRRPPGLPAALRGLSLRRARQCAPSGAADEWIGSRSSRFVRRRHDDDAGAGKRQSEAIRRAWALWAGLACFCVCVCVCVAVCVSGLFVDRLIRWGWFLGIARARRIELFRAAARARRGTHGGGGRFDIYWRALLLGCGQPFDGCVGAKPMRSNLPLCFTSPFELPWRRPPCF